LDGVSNYATSFEGFPVAVAGLGSYIVTADFDEPLKKASYRSIDYGYGYVSQTFEGYAPNPAAHPVSATLGITFSGRGASKTEDIFKALVEQLVRQGWASATDPTTTRMSKEGAYPLTLTSSYNGLSIEQTIRGVDDEPLTQANSDPSMAPDTAVTLGRR
jgi:hypothetical protein